MTDRQFDLLGEALERSVTALRLLIVAVLLLVGASTFGGEGLLPIVLHILVILFVICEVCVFGRLVKTLDKFKESTSE